MERCRAGPDFAFNEPLLETAVATVDPQAADGIVVALLFLSPGKHAGAGGDIHHHAEAATPPVEVTEVIGADPLIVDILADRVDQAVGL